MNVVIRRMVFDGQCHKNVGIRSAHRRGIAVGKVDAAVGEAYVVDHVLDLACRNLFPNCPLNLIAEVCRLFNTHSRRRMHVQFERAAVHARKEVLAEPRNQHHKRADTKHEERSQKDSPVMKANTEQAAKAMTKLLKRFLKFLLEAYQRVTAWCVPDVPFLASQQILRHRRDDSPRQEIRGQHGKNHRFSKGHKQVSRHAG